MKKSLKSALTACLCLVLLSLIVAPVVAQKDKKKKGEEVIAPAPPTPFSDVKRDSLLNGLQVVSLGRTNDGRLRCDLSFRSGAMFDLAGKTGLAKVTQETLLAVNPNLVNELESLQAKMEWGVTLDHTWYRIESPTSNFETAMEIIGRLLVVENIREDAFKRAKQMQLDRIKAATALTPAERADAKFMAEIYGVHPYGHNVGGTEQSVNAILRADVYDFYKRFYLANNGVAVVTGDVRQERAVNVFKAFFGGWVKGQIVPMTFQQPQRITEVKLVKVEAPELSAVELRGGIVGLKQNDQDYVVAQVLARVLDARLKKEAGETITVKAAPRMLAGPFYFSASVAADKASEVSRKATDAFSALTSTAVSSEELAAAQAALLADYNARSVEEQLRDIEMFGLPRNHALTFADRVKAVTSADLQRVARRLLEANALTVVVLGRVNEQQKSQM